MIHPGDTITDPKGEKWKVLWVKRDRADLAHPCQMPEDEQCEACQLVRAYREGEA